MNTTALDARALAVKVPAITVAFWAIKILATTLGETGGDALSMSTGLGYAASSAVFAVLFGALVVSQMRGTGFHAARYWLTIVATTTLGTTLADFADRSLGIGYAGGSTLLAACLAGTLALWRLTLGTVAVGSVSTPSAEAFYWVAILFSQTLGTALGDWTADTAGLGYGGAAAIFGVGLIGLAWAYWLTNISRTALFWAAFILTRPLGAAVGDFLDKPFASGGLDLSRVGASAVLALAMGALIVLSRQKPASAHH